MYKTDRKFNKTAKENNRGYMYYYERLTDLAISVFEWSNLPPTVDERFLELSLFRDGMAIFFEDEVMGYLALKTKIGGMLDVYNIPTQRTAFAANGYNRPLDETNSVLIFNNRLHTNSVMEVERYARRLWDLDSTIDVNARAQKTPVLIACDETQRLTLRNLYMQYDGNMPVVYGDKNINPNALRVLQTGAPFVADKLYTLRMQIWNEALTFLGINNINTEKKERLITSEASLNQGDVVASRWSRLKSRREACERINQMFDLEIWCDFREEFATPESEINEFEEVEEIE